MLCNKLVLWNKTITLPPRLPSAIKLAWRADRSERVTSLLTDCLLVTIGLAIPR